jgi:hypothetical protein
MQQRKATDATMKQHYCNNKNKNLMQQKNIACAIEKQAYFNRYLRNPNYHRILQIQNQRRRRRRKRRRRHPSRGGG